MQKRKFQVLLSAELQKTFVVEANDADEACALLRDRWLDGVGGEIRHDDLECTNVQFDAIGRDAE